VGGTGTAWAYQQLGLEPDIVAFAKKVQLGGIMAGRRVDEVPDNVFRVSSRINSTWGGGLVDMVRSRRILEIVERDRLFDHAAAMGDVLLKLLVDVQQRHNRWVSNARGRGLLCAIDVPDGASRDKVLAGLRDRRVLMLPCGTRTVRMRPALCVGEDELRAGVAALDDVLGSL